MAGLPNLDSLVAKQLAKLGLSPDRPPTAGGWQKFLDRVSNHYKHVDEDRQLLTRSLELSSGEMAELQTRLAEEHGRLGQIVSAISDGLRGFHRVIDRANRTVTDDDISEVTTTIRHARDELSRRLSEPFEAGGASWSGEEAAHIRRELVFMSDQLLELLQTAGQRATMHKDLEVARAVQHLLMPGREVIDREWVRLAGFFQPAAQCGGDWWSTYDLASGDVLTVVGDVSGHGVAQAIITGVAKASCDVALHLSDDRVTCPELLDMLNRCIAEAAQKTLSMTCVASILDRRAHSLIAANAGHPYPLIYRPSGDPPRLRERLPVGNPLGVSNQSFYLTTRIELKAGDVVLWYTDGITAGRDPDGEPFGQERLRDALARVVKKEPEGDPARVRDGVMNELSAFCDSNLPDDDVTLVVACVAA